MDFDNIYFNGLKKGLTPKVSQALNAQKLILLHPNKKNVSFFEPHCLVLINFCRYVFPYIKEQVFEGTKMLPKIHSSKNKSLTEMDLTS